MVVRAIVKNHLSTRCGRRTNNWFSFAFKGHLWVYVHTEVVLNDVAFAINIGDGHEVAHLLLSIDHLYPLTSDNNICHACPRIHRVFLSPPLTWVKETSASGANGPDSA